MSIHSQLPYDQSTSHARIPAGGIDLIASIDSVSEAQFTASFFGSTKALHGEVAIPNAETTTHNHSNQQYSINAVTTSTGAIAERYAYSAYGEPTICDSSGSPLATQVSSINNRYSYTGREWDATVGLHHFRARWMSPKSGSFLGRDPIGYVDGLSPYGYVGSRVFLANDPFGLSAISVTINAFISKFHDPDGDGWIPLFAPRPWWIPIGVPYPENWLLGGWYVGTNDRWAGEPGDSKLSKTINMDSCSIGKSPPFDTPPTSAGTRMGRMKNGKVTQELFSPVSPRESDGVGIRPECESYWSGAFWGKMPFLFKLAPNIEVTGEVKFIAGADSVTVAVDLNTSGFPDFEILVSGNCSPSFRGFTSGYTHPQWGLSHTNFLARQNISASFDCVAQTRKCCKGSCGK